MKALVHGTRVCEVAAEEFPVAHPLQWIDCDESVTPQHTFDGVRFIPPQPSAFHEWDGAAWVVPPANQTAAHNAGIDAQIRAIEGAHRMTERGQREGHYGTALLADALNVIVGQIEAALRTIPGQEGLALERLPDLKQNAGMKKIKAAEDLIKPLRQQRLP